MIRNFVIAVLMLLAAVFCLIAITDACPTPVPTPTSHGHHGPPPHALVG